MFDPLLKVNVDESAASNHRVQPEIPGTLKVVSKDSDP
jgi:hypothetical protein